MQTSTDLYSEFEKTRLSDAELAEVLRLCEQYRANAGERLGIEAFTTLQQSMLRTLPPLAKEAKEARDRARRLGTNAGSILGEVFNLRKIIAVAIQRLGAQGEPLQIAMERHLGGDYDGALSAVAGMPSGDAESEQEQAERWAREYEGGAAWAMLFSNERAEQAEAMLPLVREARAVGAALQSKLDEAQAEIERLKDAVCHAQSDEIDRLNAEIERLRGERAPLTEDEARRWAEAP